LSFKGTFVSIDHDFISAPLPNTTLLLLTTSATCRFLYIKEKRTYSATPIYESDLMRGVVFIYHINKFRCPNMGKRIHFFNSQIGSGKGTPPIEH